MLKKGTKNLICCKKGNMRIGKYLMIAAILLGLAGAGQFSLRAEAAQDTAEASESEAMPDGAEQGLIMKAEKRIEMKAAPEETAETLMTFQKGDLIFVAEETENGWYRVVYQGNEGYVEQDGLNVLEMDIEGLDAEMAVNEAETKFVVEVVEKYRADARRSKIWGTVIIILVLGIFGVGIFSAIRTNQNGDDEKSGEKSIEKKNNEKDNDKERKGGFEKRKSKPEQMEIEDLN